MIDKSFIDNTVIRIIESSDILIEFFGRKKKEQKQKKSYKNSEVKSHIKGIKVIVKSVLKNYKFDDIYISIDDDVFGNYEKGQDFESFDDFPIVRFDSENDDEVKKFMKEFGDKVREKYPFDVDVEYDKSEVYITVSLD